MVFIRGVWVGFFDRIVGGYYNFLGPDLGLAPFHSGFEFIVVCPLFEVMSTYLFGAHFLDDDDLFSLVPVPPDVVRLDEGVGITLTDAFGLACS